MFYFTEKLPKNNFFTSTFVLLALSCLLPHSSEAQIWKNMGKKIEKKVEDQASRRLERKIDKTIDKAFDEVEGAADDAVKPGKDNKSDSSESASKSSSQPAKPASTPATTQTSDFELPASTGKSATPVADSYEFTLGVTYEMIQTKGKKQEKMPGTTLWISRHEYVGMSSAMQKNMFMVMEGGGMLAFMEDKKTYMSLGAGMAGGIMKAAETEAGKENPDYSIKKIGKETVLQYPCDIYEITSEGSKAKIWLTDAIDFDGGSFMKAFSTMARNSRSTIPGLNAQAPGGLMLKMESLDEKKNETFTMQATNVHKDGKVINTKAYKSMGGF